MSRKKSKVLEWMDQNRLSKDEKIAKLVGRLPD